MQSVFAAVCRRAACPCTRQQRSGLSPLQAGRGLTRTQLLWLILHDRCQYLADVLCGTERFALAHALAEDPDLPVAVAPVLLRWAHEVITRIGHLREDCVACLRRRLDGAPGLSWAAVAGFALVRASPRCYTRSLVHWRSR